MINKIKNIGLVLVVLFTTNLMAQPGNLPSEQVEVLKTFEATLEQSDKLNTTPSAPTIESKNEVLTYQLPTKLMVLKYEPPTIRPLPIAKEKPGKVYKGFLKAGFGTPNSPYIDAIYSGADKKNKFRYSILGKHHSANNNANIENQRFANTDLGVKGTAYLKDFAVGGNIGYTLDRVQWYGYADSLTFTEDATKQVFKDFNFNANIFNSSVTRGDFNYSGNFDFYNFADNAFTETGVIVTANLTKWIDREHPFSVTVLNDFTRYNGDLDSVTQANNVFWVNPSYTYIGRSFKIKVGAKGGVNSAFFVLPDIEAAINLAEDKFVLIAGWTGDVQKNSFRNIARYNPFVNSQNLVQNTTLQKRYGGFKGSVNGINYEFTAAQKVANNLALFLNDSTDTRRFDVVYDDKATILTFHGAVSLTEAVENLVLSAAVDYNTYNLTTEARAWHLPIFELNIGAKYKLLEDKLGLKAELYSANGLPYKDAAGLEQTLNNLLDLNFGASYQVTDNIGIFVDLNNVTNNKFLRWNNYASYGFNVMGGITAKF